MTPDKGKILWVDDEIELLRPHVLFLEEKGYKVIPVTNAEDAIILVQNQTFDLVLLDEMLNGMDGLSALTELKEIHPTLPVVMVTKSEEEALMEDAIGGKIDDYLTKPVNPSQILAICKKVLERKKIASERISRGYISELNQISRSLMEPMSWQEWIDLYVKICSWDLELDQHTDLGLRQTLNDQRKQCNSEFGRYIERNYQNWVTSATERPLLSVDLVQKFILPQLDLGKRTIFIVVDNLRLDQWMVIEQPLRNYFNIAQHHYFSILPTATPYARNAIFSGLFPAEIEKLHPEIWHQGTEDDEISYNRFEKQLLDLQLERLKIAIKPEPRYLKILDVQEARNFEKKINEYASMPLSAIVINFVDILAHSRSNSEVIREMIPDEAAFRSLTLSWFEHSSLFRAMKQIADAGNTIILTSDHGSIRGLHGTKVIGDRETSTSLRYKFGRSIKVDSKHALVIRNPEDYQLPKRGVNTDYIIAKEDFYFVYPTNYHYYLNFYYDSFQHGGISMEEMILPVVIMTGK